MYTTAGTARRAAQLLALVAVLTLPLGACDDVVGVGVRDSDLEILWPRDGETLYGYEMLRARVRGYHLEDYEIYWNIDGGVLRRMYNEWEDYPEHKSYEVDTWDWYWNGRGPYTIGFIAEDRNGRRIGRRSVRVYVD